MAIKTQDPPCFSSLLIWMNVKWITTFSLSQQKLILVLVMKTNSFDMAYLNFTLQCQQFDIFLSSTKCSA